MAEIIPRILRRKERARALRRARQSVDRVGDQEPVAGAGDGDVHEPPLLLKTLRAD